MSMSGAAFDASNLLYNRLVEFNLKEDQLIPGLAEKWTVSKDKKTYTFYLRKKVPFYSLGDFKPSRYFNADDVLFSFNRQKDKSHPYHNTNGGAYKFFYSLDLQNQILKIKKIKQPHYPICIKKNFKFVFTVYSYGVCRHFVQRVCRLSLKEKSGRKNRF